MLTYNDGFALNGALQKVQAEKIPSKIGIIVYRNLDIIEKAMKPHLDLAIEKQKAFNAFKTEHEKDDAVVREKILKDFEASLNKEIAEVAVEDSGLTTEALVQFPDGALDDVRLEGWVSGVLYKFGLIK